MKSRVTVYFVGNAKEFDNVTHVITDKNVLQLHFDDVNRVITIPFYNVRYYEIVNM